jgi:hypothetical protein
VKSPFFKLLAANAAVAGSEQSRGKPVRSAPGKRKAEGFLQESGLGSLPGPAAALDPELLRPQAGSDERGKRTQWEGELEAGVVTEQKNGGGLPRL